MLILGVHGGSKFENESDPEGFDWHDAAAVLFEDGEVIAAIEEERLNRIKHSNCFPVRAIQYCLDHTNNRLEDVDIIALNTEECHMDAWAAHLTLENPSGEIFVNGRSYISDRFQRAFGVDVADKLVFCNHHLAHAWSAFACSGFERSLVASFDGSGDEASGMIWTGNGRSLTKLREFDNAQSLGRLYAKLIKILGYGRFDEYKVMGLAPYGNPEVYRALFETCYTLLPQGEYRLQTEETWISTFGRAGLLAHARRRGASFSQMHKDFAAALQATIETIIFHVLDHYRKQTGETHLCLAGGVAHNCTANGKVLYSGLFDRVFVQPAAHDAGGALGACLYAWYESDPEARAKRLKHLYWGGNIPTGPSLVSVLDEWSDFVEYKPVPDIAATTAGLLANGAVVGWVQGRSEFGPRALGNRSILADPRPATNKARINDMVKKREAYRPFAPSVIEEKMGEFFVMPEQAHDFPFMIFVLDVQEHVRDLLGSITHTDGTARVQSVSRDTNSIYWKLLSEFGKLTGVPILLNTSFNNHAEPIVDSVAEAITCFITTGINYLVIGDYLVTKRAPHEIRRAVYRLVPALPVSRKLVKHPVQQRTAGNRQQRVAIENIKSKYFGIPVTFISAEMFSLLVRSTGQEDIATLLQEAQVAPALAEALIDEFMALWEQRVVHLHPGNGQTLSRQVGLATSVPV